MSLLTNVGTFQKITDAAPAAQSVTGVGFQPKALILFTAGKTAANAYSANWRAGIGYTTGPANSYALGFAANDNVTPSNASQRLAAKALVFVAPAETLLAECDLTSLDADGFTLTWTTNDATAALISYIALAGDAITDAAAWIANLTGGNTVTSYAALAFEPDVLFATLTAVTGAPPTTTQHTHTSFGAASRHAPGGTSIALCVSDNSATLPATSMLGPYLIAQVPASAGIPTTMASLLTLTATGFTLHHRAAAAGTTVIGLALRGDLDLWHITTPKPLGAGPQTTTLRTPALPALLFVASEAKAPHTEATTPARFALGATDGTHHAAISLQHEYAGARTYAAAAHRDDSPATLQTAQPAAETDRLSALDLTTDPLSFTFDPCTNAPTSLALFGLYERPALPPTIPALTFPMISATDFKTRTAGLTVTARVSADGAALAAAAGAVTELADGYYKFTPAGADLAGRIVTLIFSATGALNHELTFLNPR